jgi:mono/diheme cytochrome c family protein
MLGRNEGNWPTLLFAILALATPLSCRTGGKFSPPGKMPSQAEHSDAKDSQATAQSQRSYRQLIRSTAGPNLFRAYCASCHGSDAKGHGPAAEALRIKPPDLTVLAKNNAGEFPAARIQAVIMGTQAVASHGSREMPIWGPIFHQIEADVDKGNVRLDNLTKYLESIQSINPPPSHGAGLKKSSATIPKASGAELYERQCAVCHGNDLKGNGSAPPPFRTPPDLTKLARRNGGQFPAAYVSKVLRNGVRIPEHGPAEMPIWGATFSEKEELDDAEVTSQIAALVSYIRAFQTNLPE